MGVQTEFTVFLCFHNPHDHTCMPFVTGQSSSCYHVCFILHQKDVHCTYMYMYTLNYILTIIYICMLCTIQKLAHSKDCIVQSRNPYLVCRSKDCISNLKIAHHPHTIHQLCHSPVHTLYMYIHRLHMYKVRIFTRVLGNLFMSEIRLGILL